MTAPALAALALLAAPQEAPAEDAYRPTIQPASDEGLRAMQGFELAPGLEVSLFAAEPMLANPVCLAVDADGSVYVAETFRHHAGVTDIRDRRTWLHDDLASRTVADRIAFMRKHAGDAFDDYAGEQDRVRLLRDTDGDGAADVATVFAGGFDRHETGIGAGLLALGTDVYYTCIPDLWLLRDEDRDGVAEERLVLSTGYGTNICLLGHDLHGLRLGPDGLLYFSSGDRGFHVETARGVIAHPAKGAVLRCRLDGTELEVVHTGLRNPQELAFDDRGNLFTGDNNADGGDQARWVEVLEGADSGWRYPYQWIDEPVARGPWNDERLWVPHFPGQAAYVLPPLANLANGPSGLTHYPGTGLDARYADHFFLCDFRGGPGYSGVLSFALTPKGPSFEVGPTERFLWNCLPTDVEFTPLGGLVFCDWVAGWEKPGRGRVYRLADPVAMEAPVVAETARLLREGVAEESTPALFALLAHADQRVRQEAQFALVRRGAEGFDALVRAARGDDVAGARPDLARLHGIWGAGQAARDAGADLARLEDLFEDPDPEIRGQIARAAGWARSGPALPLLVERLTDAHPRVRLHAAMACGRLGHPAAVRPLLAMARRDGADPYLRHAVVQGLVGCADEQQVTRAAADASPQVRMAALLVQRRREDPAIASFLADAEPELALEAARAIHDVPIPAALPALAGELDDLGPASSAWTRRVLNAAYRLGGDGRARAVAVFALREGVEAAHAAEAIDMLATWAAPAPIDRVVGAWRPLEPRAATVLPDLAGSLLASGVGDAPEPVLLAWIRLAVAADEASLREPLATWVRDADRPSAVRVEALRALEALAAPGLEDLLGVAFADADGALRAAALAVLDRLDPARALPRIPAILEAGEFQERRTAYRILGRSPAGEATRLLSLHLDRLAAERVPAELALDLVLAAEEHADPGLARRLEARRDARAGSAELAPYLDGLFGGERARGERIFREDQALTCLRCHTDGGDGAPRVGPSLEGVGTRLTRLQLLESIVLPNRRISPGFQATVLFLRNGGAVAGRILEETGEAIRVIDSQGEVHELTPDDVEERRPDLSSMPEGMAQSLSRERMRDLLAYLGSL